MSLISIMLLASVREMRGGEGTSAGQAEEDIRSDFLVVCEPVSVYH